VSVDIALAGFNCDYWFVFIITRISPYHVLVYVDSLFHRFGSLVGLGWVSFNGSFWRGQVLLIYRAIFLDNILDRKRTCPSQPPSPVRRKYRRDMQDLAWLVCQKFGV
jgi:hypothetical protein